MSVVPITIFMPLIDEGVDVWRPVQAQPLENACYFVLGPMPDDEKWEFPPGAVVRCEMRSLSGDGGRSELRKVAHEQVTLKLN
ncbi:hypothetical protein DES32_0457 [Methylovirgula ligni]|uniref:Uncharacterized protein n=1 Tax=Methylovirgula ligni TaxID=569860 RepID=A0A3D9Z4M0_9HYPH|nr:hypothetical protein DES32_0457 [Methylovirgula ligni]